MLVFVDDQDEVVQLVSVFKRAGYRVMYADTLSEAARWLSSLGDTRCVVIGLREALAPDLSRALAEARALPSASSTSIETIAAGIEFDSDRQTILVGANVRPLTTTESRLLRVLLNHPDRPLSRAQLLDLVWGYDYSGQSREVDVYIRYLRRKLEPEPTHPRFILTVRGLGYMLKRYPST